MSVSEAAGVVQAQPALEPVNASETAVAAVAMKQPPRYLGFMAGIFSGATKLAVGHPFDTVKVRLQTAPEGKFKGPIDCVMQTFRKEGIRGFYKGATPPLIGWMCMDSV